MAVFGALRQVVCNAALDSQGSDPSSEDFNQFIAPDPSLISTVAHFYAILGRDFQKARCAAPFQEVELLCSKIDKFQ